MEVQREMFGPVLDRYWESQNASADAPNAEERQWLDGARKTALFTMGGAPDADTVSGFLRAFRSQQRHPAKGQFRICVVKQSGAAVASLEKLVVVRDAGGDQANAEQAMRLTQALEADTR
ncbi:MAG: hypothetical protein U1E65_27040 [Myxococcota bacterium]